MLPDAILEVKCNISSTVCAVLCVPASQRNFCPHSFPFSVVNWCCLLLGTSKVGGGEGTEKVLCYCGITLILGRLYVPGLWGSDFLSFCPLLSSRRLLAVLIKDSGLRIVLVPLPQRDWEFYKACNVCPLLKIFALFMWEKDLGRVAGLCSFSLWQQIPCTGRVPYFQSSSWAPSGGLWYLPFALP